jgi:tetratricopeptide (TPR) repeat protein
LEALRALGAGRPTAIAYNNLGSCLTHVEGSQAALALLREGVSFAQTRGLREMVMALQSATMTVLYEVGEWDEVLRLADEVVAEARRQGSGHDEVFAGADRGVILASRTGEEARAFCESVLERARTLDDAPLQLWALIGAALARSASGDGPGTASLVGEALELSDDVVVRAGELPHLVRLALSAEDLTLAERLLDGASELKLERYRLSHLSARAAIDEARGEHSPALEGYRNAEQRWAQWGHALERAHAAFGMGRCLIRLDQSEEATPWLRSAHQSFARLGAGPLLEQIRPFVR